MQIQPCTPKYSDGLNFGSIVINVYLIFCFVKIKNRHRLYIITFLYANSQLEILNIILFVVVLMDFNQAFQLFICQFNVLIWCN